MGRAFSRKLLTHNCVRDETVVGTLNQYLYKNIILKTKSNYGSYQLLALELDSIQPPRCRRADKGWREECRSDRDGGSEAEK